jgi:phospholipid/cholesterol/gamma-HCH transport system ATP-binding protein
MKAPDDELLRARENELAKAPENELPVAVKGLQKSFGEQRVLNGIDLHLAHGETMAVLGRSGTGKSVLLKLLVGIQKPDSGSIRIHGKEITSLDLDGLNEVRKQIGFLFQQAALYDSLTIEDNVEFPLRRHTTLSAAERKERARELLAQVGMDHELEKLPFQISGGMQKRVGLARALALDPDLLLFDEPTSGLDPITGGEIGKLISQLKKQRQITSLMVTHDVAFSRSFVDRFLLLHEGDIRIEGTFDDLQKSHDPFVSRFMREAEC